MKRQLLCLTALSCIAPLPALAETETPAANGQSAPAFSAETSSDPLLETAESETFRAIFADIRARNWERAHDRLVSAPDSVLEPVARAELFLAAGSPRVALEQLAGLLADAPDLPDADRLTRLAQRRGLDDAPALPRSQSLRRLPGPSRRAVARPVRDDSSARALVRRIRPLIVDDSPREAENLVVAAAESLSAAGLTEARQRVAWSYYLTGDDENAQRVARQARQGVGDWAVHADWVDGLASWRRRDCGAASNAFASVARRAPDSELRAAGLYWASRSEMACNRPQNVQQNLRTAARMNETFYGMLAAETLGISSPAGGAHIVDAGWNQVESDANARRALALAEIGERTLAEQYVRHGATIGDAQHHDAWRDLAGHLDLPDAQLWNARHAPVSHHPSASDRYPAPSYRPSNGWRVDRSLVFAHALQESNFRPDAVSPVGARGLLQLMPGTARGIARQRGEQISTSRLNTPEVNIEYGQHFMEEMRDFPGTQGLLPKVIASYNAGPGAVVNWESRLRDRGDPLLYIESIPFYETRQYVPIVLRNYWMYQRNAGEDATSLTALAQGLWPRFPGAPGPVAVRLSGQGGTRVAD
jgi:soluble lytic murein transglycosylase-like protein